MGTGAQHRMTARNTQPPALVRFKINVGCVSLFSISPQNSIAQNIEPHRRSTLRDAVQLNTPDSVLCARSIFEISRYRCIDASSAQPQPESRCCCWHQDVASAFTEEL